MFNIFNFICKCFHKKYKKRYASLNLQSNENEFEDIILKLNIINFYHCIDYQQIRRATNKIFSDSNRLPIQYNPNEIQAACQCSSSIISREVTSAYFANMVLDSIDREIYNYSNLQQVKYYRHMDDIFLLGNKEACRNICNLAYNLLKKYNFILDIPEHTLIYKDKQKIRAIIYNYLESLQK